MKWIWFVWSDLVTCKNRQGDKIWDVSDTEHIAIRENIINENKTNPKFPNIIFVRVSYKTLYTAHDLKKNRILVATEVAIFLFQFRKCIIEVPFNLSLHSLVK